MSKFKSYLILGSLSFVILLFSLVISQGDMISFFRECIISPGLEMDVFLHLRLPRVIMALVVGASLSVSGAVFQGLLRNNLADPYIIGVSGGAAFGVALAEVFFPESLTPLASAAGGSLTSIALVYLIARIKNMRASELALSGIALSFIFSSGVLLLFAFSESRGVHRAIMWLMGDLSIGRYNLMYYLAPLCLVLMCALFLFYRHLNILSLGRNFSKSLGIERKEISCIFWISALLASLTVSLCGVIGFVGLMMPHVSRRYFGSNYLHLLPASAVSGAVFLLFCDTLGRTIAPPIDIPSGVITGFAGGIFFLVAVLRSGRA